MGGYGNHRGYVVIVWFNLWGVVVPVVWGLILGALVLEVFKVKTKDFEESEVVAFALVYFLEITNPFPCTFVQALLVSR